MELQAFTAIAELIGAIAIVATLVYLAIEIRQNTDSVNTARYEAITAGFNDIDCVIIADPALPILFNKGMLDPESLNDEEKARMAFIFRMFHNQYYKIFHLYDTGVLPKKEWVTYARQCAQLFGSPGGRIYLEGNPDYPEISQIVNEYSSKAGVFDFALEHHENNPPPNK